MQTDAKLRILDAAVQLRLQGARDSVTVESVAAKADCAKGLIAYHFKTKKALFEAAERAIQEQRTASWSAALRTADPQAAINACWKVVVAEARTGGRGVVQELTDWSTKNGFPLQIGKECLGLLRRAGRAPSIPETELADLCGVTLTGFAGALAAGADARKLEAAYAAFWASAFSLTRAA